MKRVGKPELLAEIGAPTGCMMCELVRGVPVAESAHAVAVLDRYASRPGHVLVVTRRHEERIAKLTAAEHADMFRLVHEVCHAIEAVFEPRRIYVAALGSAEPLAVSCPHVHVHCVPLVDGGDADRPAEVFTWAQGMYVFESADEERALRERLRAALRVPHPEHRDDRGRHS